jgi:hypothetical protein
MGLFTKKKLEAQSFNTVFVQEKSVTDVTPPPETPADSSEVTVSAQNVQGGNAATNNTLDKPLVTTQAILLGAIASIGGFMFGYESGQISGMLKVYLKNLKVQTINVAQDSFRCLTFLHVLVKMENLPPFDKERSSVFSAPGLSLAVWPVEGSATRWVDVTQYLPRHSST